MTESAVVVDMGWWQPTRERDMGHVARSKHGIGEGKKTEPR